VRGLPTHGTRLDRISHYEHSDHLILVLMPVLLGFSFPARGILYPLFVPLAFAGRACNMLPVR
jgi:hypothetical protein